MKDDVRKYIFGTLIVFVVGVLVWGGFIFVSACGFSLTCKQGALPVERTPIPTLLPASLPSGQMGGGTVGQCRVAAVDLIGAWVAAGSPEKDIFSFTNVNGQGCEATFEDVKPLFTGGNLWTGNIHSCVSCHSADLTTSAAQLDLNTYAGVTAGSRRADAASTGTDILGGGNWESSLLFDFLTTAKADVVGHKNAPAKGVFIFVGKPLPVPTEAPKPTSTPMPAATPTP
jgi:hypothetical protein